MKDKVALLIACYGGERRCKDQDYESDHACYLKMQIDSLENLDFSCEVIFISNGGFSDYLNYWDTIKYTKISRSNIGMSYAAWTEAYECYPDYDYYIAIEDDYMFVVDNFDQLMVDQFKYWSGQDSRCGYVCQYLGGDFPLSMNGIVSNWVLQQTGGFGYSPGYEGDYWQNAGQRGWANAVRRIKQPITNEPFRIFDMSHKYKVPFNEFGSVRWYAEDAPEFLLIPAQIYNDYKNESSC